MATEQDLKRDVEAELRWDPRFADGDIAVSVKGSTVALTGFTHSSSDRHDAEEAVKRVKGVAAVANDIEVRLPAIDERPDPEIARDIVAALKLQLSTFSDNVKTVVSEGRVSLEGELEWHYQREVAEGAARRVRGVKSVGNHIRISARATPADIKQAIASAFRRSASLDAQKLSVEGHNGEIVLRGNVRTWAERQEAHRAAWNAAGVRSVDNRITVGD